MRAMHELEHAIGQAGLAEALGETLRAQSGVWFECFRITALPAMIAGTTEFTDVR